MSRPLLLAAPLLAYALFTAARAALGRLPSRAALNVESSVLLLGYFLLTAALGLFWVANQQLPPFDWHYLAGYFTTLLIGLHLAFNLRVVVAHVRRKPAMARSTNRSSGRVVPWLVGCALSSGAAFYFGLRSGGTTLVVGDSATGQASAALGAIERFHKFSSHSRAGVTLRAPSVGWETPRRDRRAAAAELLALPPAGRQLSHWPSLSNALLEPGRAREPIAALGELSLLLFATAGVSERRGGLSLRTSASSGALFPSEVYVIAWQVAGLAPGVYAYHAEPHALSRLTAERVDLGAAGVGSVQHEPALALVVTSVFQRTGQKYRDRTYRYVAADAGHALGNLLAAASELGFDAHVARRFDESVIARALGVDEAEEGVMSVVTLHAQPLPTRDAGEPAFKPAPFADPQKLSLGVTTLAHLATSLRLHTDPALRGGAHALPAPVPASSTTFEAIARRRSVRIPERSQSPCSS